MAPSKTAALSLNDMVNEDRKRRKNANIAQEIFSKNRRASAPGAGQNTRKAPAAAGVPSLASRIGTAGISKRSASTASSRGRAQTQATPGNVNQEWTHDLHSLNNPSAGQTSRLPPRGPKALRNQRSERLQHALKNSASSPALNSPYNIVGSSKPTPSISIRGIAGPYAVMVKNMAVGTTAADIESAMTPVGGVVLSCRIITERPGVIAEIVFETKEGADNVVDTFHGANADGNTLDVYHKTGPVNYAPKNLTPTLVPSAPRSVTPVGPRADAGNDRSQGSRYGGSERYTSRDRSRDRDQRASYGREEVVDGSYGFEDKMDTDERDKGLYSDSLLNGRGRGNGNGYNRDRGGRGNDRSRNYR